jgi:hypothetical protein
MGYVAPAVFAARWAASAPEFPNPDLHNGWYRKLMLVNPAGGRRCPIPMPRRFLATANLRSERIGYVGEFLRRISHGLMARRSAD